MPTVLTALAAVTAAVLTGLLGRFLIPFLHKVHFGQTIREIGPSWHRSKQGTPTMGGVMFILGSLASAVIFLSFLWGNGGAETQLSLVKLAAGMLMALGFGLVGFFDDYIGIKKHRNLGLTEVQKLILQFLIAGAYLVSLRFAGAGTEVWLPFLGTFDLGFAYYILAALVIVGMVNAVNFADGIDGLNGSVTAVYCVTFCAIAAFSGMQGMMVLSMAVFGSLLGFLFWNWNPAKVFMGDTGSLFLGGMVCALAFGTDRPILLPLAGIIYVAEILSVVLQVSYFKATHGKRIFKMSPIHHHFEMCGWKEVKICFVFSLVGLVGGALSVLLVYFG